MFDTGFNAVLDTEARPLEDIGEFACGAAVAGRASRMCRAVAVV